MLTTPEIIIFSMSSLILPAVLYCIVTFPEPPESWASKYYRAEKYLYPCSNLFLLMVCIVSIGRLAGHFGWVSDGGKEVLSFLAGGPFMILLLAANVLWVRAWIKVRRLEKQAMI